MAQPDATLSLLLEIQELTKEEGQLSPQVRDRLILKTLGSVLERLNKMDAKLDVVEKASIGLWFQRNPKLGMTIVSVGLLLLNLWFVSDFRKPVMAALGLPVDLVP